MENLDTVIKRNKEFEVHKLSDIGLEKAGLIRDLFDTFLTALEQLLTTSTSSREFSIVKTKLEEACFFAKKSMAINLSNQKQGE